MSSRRHRIGRVKVDFSIIEKLAAEAASDMPLVVVSDAWSLSRKSSLHRCKNGTYTLCLIWKSDDGFRMTSTMRGLRLQAGEAR